MRAPRINRVSKIVAVEASPGSKGYDRIILYTPTSDVVIRCDQGSDEVVVAFAKKGKRKWRGTVLMSGDSQVSWTWLMVNQQGYTDGFRVELGGVGATRVFDFVAIASAIEVWEAIKSPANKSLDTTRGK